jgi:hypothetical protein
MPIVRNVIGGAQITASAKIARRFPITFGVGGGTSVDTDAQLQVNTLPNCFWYVLIPAGSPVLAYTFTPRFAVDNFGTLPRYFNLLPPQNIVPGTPFSLSQRIAANMVSGVLFVPAALGAPLTIDIILSASL